MNTMKKIFYTILILGFSLHIFSQSDESKRTVIGGYLGGNVSQLLTDSLTDTGARIGYQFGGFIRFGGDFFVRGDISLFSMSSQLVETPDTMSVITGGYDDIEDKIDIEYIHVPVQIGYKLFSSPDGTSAFWVAAGAYVDQIYKVKPNDLNLVKGDFNTTSYGLLATAGLDLWVLTLHLNYQYGMSPIFKNDDQSLKYTFSFSLGVKF
jgi:hypothetical protein